MLKRNDKFVLDSIKTVKIISKLLGYRDVIESFMKDNTNSNLKRITEKCNIYSSKYFKSSIVQYGAEFSKIYYKGKSICIDVNPLGLSKPPIENVYSMTISYFTNEKNIVGIEGYYGNSIYCNVDFRGINIEELEEQKQNILKIMYIDENEYNETIEALDDLAISNLFEENIIKLRYRVYNKLKYKLQANNSCLNIVNDIDVWLFTERGISKLDISYSEYGITIKNECEDISVIFDNCQKLFEMEMDCTI